MSRFTPRKGMPSPRLDEAEFRKRFLAQFRDPGFNSLAQELDKIAAAAWDAYSQSRKAPRTRKAGSQFADPDYDLSVDWLAARAAIIDAHRRHADRSKPAVLPINCSARSERPMASAISLWLGHSSRRNTGRPSRSRPRGSVSKSMSTVPASA